MKLNFSVVLVMKKTSHKIIVSLMILLFAVINCKKEDINPKVENILCDIAYCLQNPSGNPYHQLYTINQDGSDNKMLIKSSMGLNHHD